MMMIEQEQAQSNDFVFMALFARMDTVAMAAAVSLLFALGLPTATTVLLLLGAPPGVPIGPNLSALGKFHRNARGGRRGRDPHKGRISGV
jgi:hypothetical protein